ncbi:MAG TPA: NUDIX hydrolase [Candidatus Binataceae bacterium]|nr:NUDIX hydrolase [Candidatus Binataceae bacterium]
MAAVKKSASNKTRRAVRRELSAGGLVWRRGPGGTVQVILVRPTGRDAWVLPKGHVESGETIAQTAIREVREETGVKAKVSEPLGEVAYVFSQRERESQKAATIFKRVQFYLMEYEGGALADHDDEIAEAQWVDLEESVHLLTYDNERELVARARVLLRA